ncbi:classical arabinogalactan protein 4-like [Ochotona curzoniae]|uniref:classical arabinogalactan protein 4-like n=1 Tax=Ochotona curzoniae TaxID=130825 RepID=UPI001B34EFA1|nr:classical arabinogalactan protein 4-like [Ochotona curzoniae]
MVTTTGTPEAPKRGVLLPRRPSGLEGHLRGGLWESKLLQRSAPWSCTVPAAPSAAAGPSGLAAAEDRRLGSNSSTAQGAARQPPVDCRPRPAATSAASAPLPAQPGLARAPAPVRHGIWPLSAPVHGPSSPFSPPFPPFPRFPFTSGAARAPLLVP